MRSSLFVPALLDKARHYTILSRRTDVKDASGFVVSQTQTVPLLTRRPLVLLNQLASAEAVQPARTDIDS